MNKKDFIIIVVIIIVAIILGAICGKLILDNVPNQYEKENKDCYLYPNFYYYIYNKCINKNKFIRECSNETNKGKMG